MSRGRLCARPRPDYDAGHEPIDPPPAPRRGPHRSDRRRRCRHPAQRPATRRPHDGGDPRRERRHVRPARGAAPRPLLQRHRGRRPRRRPAGARASWTWAAGRATCSSASPTAGSTATGIDLDPAMVERAAARLGTRAEVVEASSAALPFPDGILRRRGEHAVAPPLGGRRGRPRRDRPRPAARRPPAHLGLRRRARTAPRTDGGPGSPPRGNAARARERRAVEVARPHLAGPADRGPDGRGGTGRRRPGRAPATPHAD